jgi:hypothetical protein
MKNISRRIPKRIPKIPRKTLEIIWDTRNPNKLLGTHEKDFRAFQNNMDIALDKVISR